MTRTILMLLGALGCASPAFASPRVNLDRKLLPGEIMGLRRETGVRSPSTDGTFRFGSGYLLTQRGPVGADGGTGWYVSGTHYNQGNSDPVKLGADCYLLNAKQRRAVLKLMKPHLGPNDTVTFRRPDPKSVKTVFDRLKAAAQRQQATNDEAERLAKLTDAQRLQEKAQSQFNDVAKAMRNASGIR